MNLVRIDLYTYTYSRTPKVVKANDFYMVVTWIFFFFLLLEVNWPDEIHLRYITPFDGDVVLFENRLFALYLIRSFSIMRCRWEMRPMFKRRDCIQNDTVEFETQCKIKQKKQKFIHLFVRSTLYSVTWKMMLMINLFPLWQQDQPKKKRNLVAYQWTDIKSKLTVWHTAYHFWYNNW